MSASGCFAPPGPAPTPEEPLYSHPLTLLRNFPFNRLVVEIDFVDGRQPSNLALEGLRRTLQDVTHKESILFLPAETLPEQRSPYSIEDLERIREAHFDSGPAGWPYGHGGNATLHILYLNGAPQEGYWGLHTHGIFVFPDVIQRAGPASPLVRDKYERSTLIHELGHAFGLVNMGIPMLEPREDPRSRGHSTREESVMYSGVAGAVPFPANLVMDPPWTFDKYDWADMRSYQGS